MTLSALMNLPVTIVTRTATDELDEFGNERQADASVVTVGELQQLRRDEPDDQGELSDAYWALFLPAGTMITTGDVVLAGGQQFEVVGDPWRARNPRTQVASHIECTLRRAAGDEDGS